MEITFSVDDDVFIEARRRAEASGTSIDQLLNQYLETLAGKSERLEAAEEFMRMSIASTGDSNGWKFNRDEIHER